MTAKATNEAPDDGILRIGDTAEEPKYDVLFRLGGKECKGLANPSASLMLRYIDMQRKRGGNIAASWLVEEMLDADAYETLTTSPNLARGEWQQVFDLLSGILFGSGDAVPKQRRTGTPRTGG